LQELLTTIRKDLSIIGVKQKELANDWGVSPSGVSDVFNSKREMSFCFLSKTLIRLNNFYGSKKQKEIILNFISIAKPENRREALEFAYQQGEFDLLKWIIDMEKQSKTFENREWADVFDLIIKRNTENLGIENFYNLIDEKRKKVTTLEMKIFLDLTKIQTLYQTGNYKLLNQKLINLEKEIQKITNKFIKLCYQVRFKEAVSVISLQRGKIQETRKTCREILEICEAESFLRIPAATALFKMGESFVFEDYEVSKEYLEKAISFLANDQHYLGMARKRQFAKNTLLFLKIHEGKLEGVIPEDIHPAELAYLRIQQRKESEAIEILLELEKENDELSDIQTFYLGLAKKEEGLIIKSLQKFEDTGNIFYSQLPKKYLGIL
jgi:hypothetical protein